MMLVGKNIIMRTVEVEDAEFVFTMRQNKTKTKYLSVVTGTIETQKEWIINYKQRENQKEEFYFVIESKDKEKLGLVRIYDFQHNSFSWGSWLIKEDAPKTTAIESALQIYEFGFYELNFENSHFEVQKRNDKVIAFHQRFGAKIIGENGSALLFDFKKNDYEITKEKYRKYF
ncbi:GNAT family N-acetyltransferase [Sulfurospirillum diekertiae]|uniref:GNAT family N-acetyltransferase n=1 Tax=Sulfurospirillum diekertiae TaxID=1854492 RepID=A0A6G9VRF4_9BACT|nr:GNAT family N-acetyltransferase [Sulfurospirillum diekertiae]QIR75449.1 GNAT family N-acetyltransferase [Sulfurospirillum diekertiae]QIR78097.1 GNAT family N-acetyltransferase [Sulfurospirillum diekertiae]